MEGRKRPRTRLLMAPGLLRTPVVLGSRVYLHTRRIVLRPVLTTYTQLLWEENSAARSQACFEMFSPPLLLLHLLQQSQKEELLFTCLDLVTLSLIMCFTRPKTVLKTVKKDKLYLFNCFYFF